MINQGIVTDSDTEKELQRWQQARENPVDEERLKRQYKNRINNAQGQHFENEILAGCNMYEQHGIATIDKTPEPFKVTSKNHRTGEFTGRFSKHAQPDFQGTLYGGRSIVFEAKRTTKDRITRNVLTDTQMKVLEKHNRLSVINTVIRGLNKLKVPDWVPGIGGMGINIPEIPGFAKGTNRTPSTFIAGENGPELITDAANRKVFTAAQTGQIFNNMAGAANLNTANNVNATAGAAGTITIHVTNSPSVTVTGGGDTSGIKEQLQQYDEEFLEKLRDIIRAILKEQKEQEGRVAYA